MKNETLMGQFARLPNGERVFVEVVGKTEGNFPARALVRRIEGERVGTRASCFVDRLEMLGHEIPKEDPALTAS